MRAPIFSQSKICLHKMAHSKGHFYSVQTPVARNFARLRGVRLFFSNTVFLKSLKTRLNCIFTILLYWIRVHELHVTMSVFNHLAFTLELPHSLINPVLFTQDSFNSSTYSIPEQKYKRFFKELGSSKNANLWGLVY